MTLWKCDDQQSADLNGLRDLESNRQIHDVSVQEIDETHVVEELVSVLIRTLLGLVDVSAEIRCN